ncbi:MAG: tetratricopeptide repeat protein [Leptospiraceae bacterium]|nr:tetratricopeptide repeat protein [Leptospiraceae bacterium]MDW8307534.1 tetratricopeptide repeat protein [Leptospiraceae bacterium]
MWPSPKNALFLTLSIALAAKLDALTEHPSFAEKETYEAIATYYKKKAWDNAVSSCEKALEQYASSLPFYELCGHVYLHRPGNIDTKKGDYGKAIRLWQKALEAYQHNLRSRKALSELHFYLGLAYHFSRNYDMAISWYYEALRQNDLFSAAWYNMAACYEAQGNIIEANRAYLRYLRSLRQKEDEF